nr:MAG: replication associated protein [Cressdnaviricota sp.]
MSEINEINEKARGNTASRAKKEPRQSNYWCFTFNNYDEKDIEIIENIFHHECKWYIFQEETGEETGTPHLQGICNFITKKGLPTLKQFHQKISWDITKSVKGSVIYCTKFATRTGKIYSSGIEIPRQLDIEEPYGWQTQILDIIKTIPDKRTIYWFWEPNGNVGKSTLCKYLVVKHDALMLTGKSNDMYHMISKFPNKRNLIICDIPRTSMNYINYAAIEQIKNGLIFSGKYEGTQLVFNCPHLIVFANEKPNLESMSLDRWNVIKITI